VLIHLDTAYVKFKGQGHRTSSRSKEENVAEVVGATSSEAFCWFEDGKQ